MRKFAALGLLTYLVASVAIAQSHPEIPKRPQALRELDGHWIMSGDVMGKPVTYRMTAGPTLRGAFTEMHMNDVQRPSQYEARVFIGYDPKGDRIIVHWMDSFGAAYSIPHGSGSIDGNTLRFTFAYPSGPFRDTLAFHPGSKTWTLVIEASKADGSISRAMTSGPHRRSQPAHPASRFETRDQGLNYLRHFSLVTNTQAPKKSKNAHSTT